MKWFEEIQKDSYGMKWKVKEHLFSKKSSFQQVDGPFTTLFRRSSR